MELVPLTLHLGIILSNVHPSTAQCLPCHPDATCMTNTGTCECNPGFIGNGIYCEDFDECSATGTDRHDCDMNGNCTNTDGGFTCTCRDGYSGTGRICTDDPPVFSNAPCQSLISHVAPPESSTAVVTWTNPPATDPPNAAPTVTCTPVSDSSLAIGSHTITCTATDSAGGTATCVFQVTVFDFDECSATGSGRHDCDVNALCTNTDGGFTCACRAGYSGDGRVCTDNDPPMFVANTCPSSFSKVADRTSLTKVVTWTDPSATDSTGVPPTVTCTPASGSTFSIGDRTVTCTATDAAGNDAVTPCTFTVTVTDFDECNAMPPSQHNCDVNADCINIDGDFICTCRAGYTGDGRTCEDNDPPVFDATPCQSPVSEVADPTSTTTLVNWPDPSASDSTGVPLTVTCTPASGSAFMIGAHFVTCTATDATGNTAVTSCTFTVSVTDFDECSATGSGRHGCDVNADCTNTDGGFTCTCRDGYSGNGRTCTDCVDGLYGQNCASVCTCVIDATCDKLIGDCACSPAFPDAVCDKLDSAVSLTVGNEPVLDTSAVDNAALICSVNLPSRDLLLPVTITFPDNTVVNAAMTTEGSYEFTLIDINAADSGNYTCTATTLIRGTPVSNTGVYALDVLIPGRIISLTSRVEGELTETVMLECKVFARPPPTITWYDKNSAVISSSDPKYAIANSTDGSQEQLTSTLSVRNLVREDTGTYACETSNSLTPERDRREGSVVVIEEPEVGFVTGTAISAVEIEVSWQVTFDGNLPYTCTVEYKVDGSATWTVAPTAPQLALSQRVPGLEAYTLYTVRVSCRNTVGVGNVAVLMTPVRTLQAAPSAPRNVQVISSTSASLTLLWEEPAEKRGTIAFYEVSTTVVRSDIMNTFRTPGPGNPAPTSLEATGLVPDRNYTIFVTAFNVEGGDNLRGEDSDSIVWRTHFYDPYQPIGVLLNSEGDACVVTWDFPQGGIQIDSIVSYTIFRNAYMFPGSSSENYADPILDESKSDTVVIRNQGQRSYTVEKNDLPPYAQYRFVIRTSTPNGDGADSAETEMTCDTPRAVPVVPGPPVLSSGVENPITESTFKIRLPPVNQRNGPISCIEVTVIRLSDEDTVDGKDPDILYHPDLHRSFEQAQEASGLPYVAVVLAGNDLTESKDIEIGSGGLSQWRGSGPAGRQKRQEFREHLGENGALMASTKYTAFTRVYTVLEDGTETYATSPLLQPVWTGQTAAGSIVPIMIAVVSVATAVLIIVVAFCAVRLRMKRRTKNMRKTRTTVEMDEVDYEMSLSQEGVTSTVYEDVGLPTWALRWEILRKNLVVDDRVLGKGNFGEVRSGSVNIGGKMTKAAIKILKGRASQTEREDFMEEFRTMTNIGYHPNVVSLIGACQYKDVLYVALEYLPNGDLRSYLREARLQSDSDEGALSSGRLVKFALDVAKGMKHLAMSGVIHRDLAARNILLGQELIAKVSDFGLSRGEDIYVQTSMRRVPARWLAIESLTLQTYTTQSDVWSFGILLWEIASIGGTPYPAITTKALPERLMEGYRMTKPKNCDEEIYALMLRCWQEEPKKRPTFSELITILSKMDDNREEHIYMAIDQDGYDNFSVIRPELDDN